MVKKPVKIVAIGVGSVSFGRSVLADTLSATALNGLDCTLTLVDINAESLERMYRLAERMKEVTGSTVKLERTTSRTDALPGADYVVISVAIQRYPLWEQDFRVPLALGFRHVLGENGGPGAAFHCLRSFGLVLPICQDIERLCPNALVLNYTNPESRVIMAINRMTNVRAAGLCHGFGAAYKGISQILERPVEDLDIVSGGLNHFFWVSRIADRKTGEDLYPRLRDRIANDPDCPMAPPLVKKMVEVFGHYTYPSDDHIGEYLSFAHEFTGVRWHYGQECKQVTRQPQPAQEHWLDKALRESEPLDRNLVQKSGELALEIVQDIEFNRGTWEPAVNVLNDGLYVPNLPADAVVEVPAVVDADGLHPQAVPALPEALAAFCRTQVSLQKLLVEAHATGSRNLLLQALLLDPAVNSVSAAEKLLDIMLDLQKDFLPEFT